MHKRGTKVEQSQKIYGCVWAEKEAFVLLLSHLRKVRQQGDALNRLPQAHLVCQDPIDSLQPGEKHQRDKSRIVFIFKGS